MKSRTNAKPRTLAAMVQQRLGTATGYFITIEDETGISNLEVFQILFEKFRKEIVRSTLLGVEGKLQREVEVTHAIASRCYDLSGLLSVLNIPTLAITLSCADEGKDKRVKKDGRNAG